MDCKLQPPKQNKIKNTYSVNKDQTRSRCSDSYNYRTCQQSSIDSKYTVNIKKKSQKAKWQCQLVANPFRSTPILHQQGLCMRYIAYTLKLRKDANIL